MPKATTPSFVVELPLRVGADGEAALERAFQLGRFLYNATLDTVLGQDRELRQSKAWMNAIALPKGKERSERLKSLMRDHGLTKPGVEKILNRHFKKSKREKQIDSNTGQKIALRIWETYSRWCFEKGGRPRFKGKNRPLHSLEGKKNSSGIRFRWYAKNRVGVEWLGLKLYAVIDRKDAWLMQALADPVDPSKRRRVKYCRVLWRNVEGRKRWYVQLICEGNTPLKHVYAGTDIKAGIDPSLCSVTVAYEDGTVEKIAFGSELRKEHREIRRLQRQIDRSRRANNPQNFEENGTVKKGSKTWKKSKNLIQLEAQLADLHRKAVAHRKNLAGQVANWILGHAGCLSYEINHYKAFQRSHFGSSILKGAPGQLLTILKTKAESAGCVAMEVSPLKLRPSQHDIETGEFQKHDLWERWIKLGESGLWINRDALAALNLLWLDETGENYLPPTVLKERWEAVKQVLLDAGWLVEVRDEELEDFLRQLRRRDRKATSVRELRQKRYREQFDTVL